MFNHHTFRSVSYNLVSREDPWIVWCVMALYRAYKLRGSSAPLIDSVVRMAQKRRRIPVKALNEAREILRQNHLQDLVEILRKSPLRREADITN